MGYIKHQITCNNIKFSSISNHIKYFIIYQTSYNIITLDHHHPLSCCPTIKVTFWKNVSGVYTADPRQVPEAFPINSRLVPSRLKGQVCWDERDETPVNFHEILRNPQNFSWLMVFHGLFHAEKPAQNTIMSPSFF